MKQDDMQVSELEAIDVTYKNCVIKVGGKSRGSGGDIPREVGAGSEGKGGTQTTTTQNNGR